MFRPEHPLETARLTLRPFTPDDFDDLYAYQSRQDVARYLHWEARDHAQVREALALQRAEIALTAVGDWLTFAVVWREAGKVVGEAGLKLISRESRQGEIGFLFHPDYHGRGLATEAGSAAVDWGFTEGGLERIVSIYEPENAASGRVMERLGFTYERTTTGPARGLTVRVMQLTRERWEELAGSAHG